MFQCGVLSLIVHVALLGFIGHGPQHQPHRPLVVDLRYVAADPAPLATPAAEAKMPDLTVENPKPQAPNPTQDLARAAELPKPASAAPAPIETYWGVEAVDVRAEPANDVPLVYPLAALARHVSGVVRFNLFGSSGSRVGQFRE